jgi:glycosyltransferase involved in cell wall biosynthesis
MTPTPAIERSTQSSRLSVVVPVFNEEKNIPEFISRVVPIIESLSSSYEIIFCVDPSTDQTINVIRSAHTENPCVKMLEFSRRFGQPTATLAGIDYADGDAVIVMDVDLQDPPELLAEMVSKWHEGFEVVYAQRRKRDGETLVKKVVAKVGYATINRFSDVSIPKDTGDFRLLDRRAVDELKRFPEAHGFLRGLVALVGFRQVAVAFDRPARFSGDGNYNRFFGSLKIGFNGIIAFSSALLSLSTILGFVAAVLSFVVGILYGVLKLTGTKFPIGNPTVVILLLLIGGLQLICLGIIGQYIGRIYEETKRRPRYIVFHELGFDRHPSTSTLQGDHAG